MKEYLALCLEGEPSIPKRKVILADKKEALLQSIAQLQEAVEYIDWKQNFYDDVLSGKIEYYSNLISSVVKGEISAEDFEDMPCGIRILLIWKRQFKNSVNF